jgi:Uncharacterised nucleotidyltransferase
MKAEANLTLSLRVESHAPRRVARLTNLIPFPSTALDSPMTPAVDHLLDALSLDTARFGEAQARALSLEDWRSIVAMAGSLGVAGLLAIRLDERGLMTHAPRECESALHRAARLIAIRNLQVRADLRVVIDALRARQIDALVLKGPHLTAAVYRDLSARLTGDIDLLIRWKDLDAAAKTLEALGYRARKPYHVDERVDPYLAHQLPRFDKDGATGIDLHWTIGMTGRIDVDGLWTRAVPARVTDRDALVLSPEDFVVHLCGHAGHHHTFECGMRPLCDIAAAIRCLPPLDWSAVVSRSRAWGWARANALILQLTRDLAGGDVPDHVLTELCPDPVPAQMRAIALRHMTAGAPEETTLHQANHSVLSLSTQGTLGKLRLFCRSIFLSRTEMARRYPISPASPLLLAYYPLRIVDVIRRHWRLTLQLHGDSALARMAHDKTTLQSWIDERA